MHGMLGGASRIMEIFATHNAMPDGTQKPSALNDRIELQHVSFAYRDGSPVLRDINLTVRKGETVALVGPSGGGKTTLMDLILRLYDPTEGVILYDGVDVRQFRQRAYRQNFGVVPQDPFLFHTTVRDNIVYSRQADDATIDYAITAANAKEFVERLPQGLDTIAGPRGTQPSGGQRQRIAIARAIYGRPSILFLDEATSSLDSESEHAVQEAIARIVKDMTAIIIAHRLSTVAHADRVVVIADGRIEAEGRHDEVMAQSVTYRRLYGLQFNQDPKA
jgi:ABC-type multidrug transport system fused ATPase/permease subunit